MQGNISPVSPPLLGRNLKSCQGLQGSAGCIPNPPWPGATLYKSHRGLRSAEGSPGVCGSAWITPSSSLHFVQLWLILQILLAEAFWMSVSHSSCCGSGWELPTQKEAREGPEAMHVEGWCAAPRALGAHTCGGWPAACWICSPSSTVVTFSFASLGPGRCVWLYGEGCQLLQGACVTGGG